MNNIVRNGPNLNGKYQKIGIQKFWGNKHKKTQLNW